MGDMLARGSAWLEGRRKTDLSSEVVYFRPAVADGAPMQAMIGQSTFNAVDRQGFVSEVQTRDFLVSKTDVVEAGFFPPIRGDWIEQNGERFDVLNPTGENPWRYTDGFQNTVRIHTRKIKE